MSRFGPSGAKNTRALFERFDLKHVIRGHNISAEAVERAIALSTDKYCSAVATVRPTAEVVTTYEIQPETELLVFPQ